jgi:predicted Zn-dependent protease
MKHSAKTLAAGLILLLCFTPAVPARSGVDLRVDETQRPAQQPKVKEGGKDDLDAIGNRDIGGRGLGNWYSLETEIRLGREYAQMVDSSVKLVQEPVITEYVNRVGQNIVRNSDAKVPFTIKVIDASEVNAFVFSEDSST